MCGACSFFCGEEGQERGDDGGPEGVPPRPPDCGIAFPNQSVELFLKVGDTLFVTFLYLVRDRFHSHVLRDLLFQVRNEQFERLYLAGERHGKRGLCLRLCSQRGGTIAFRPPLNENLLARPE